MSTGFRSLFKLISFGLVLLLAHGPVARAQQSPLVERVWYEGDTPRRVWMATDEMAVVFDGRNSPRAAQDRFEAQTPQAALMKQDGTVAYYKMPQHSPEQDVAAARRESGVRHASPVFYQNPGNPRSAMALSGEIIVSFRAEPSAQLLDQLTKRFGLTLVQKLDFVPNTFLFDARSSTDSLDLANTIRTSGGVAAAYPNWIRSFGRR